MIVVWLERAFGGFAAVFEWLYERTTPPEKLPGHIYNMGSTPPPPMQPPPRKPKPRGCEYCGRASQPPGSWSCYGCGAPIRNYSVKVSGVQIEQANGSISPRAVEYNEHLYESGLSVGSIFRT